MDMVEMGELEKSKEVMMVSRVEGPTLATRMPQCRKPVLAVVSHPVGQ
jgi:hypothetical protein